MHQLRLLIFVIGIILSGLAYAQDRERDSELPPEGMVFVEQTGVLTTEVDGEYRLAPYTERRGRWGATASLGYSSFEPLNYEPNFVTADFVDIYETAELPLIELVMTVKRNVRWGSYGAELGVGVYNNDSDATDLVTSSLTFYPIRLGAVIAFDTLGGDPKFVPYVAGGVFTVIYREALNGNSFNGNTQVAPYARGGIAFNLDWIDRQAARFAYMDSSIQASYLYIEGQKYMASGDAKDPDFSNDISWAAGMRMEF